MRWIVLMVWLFVAAFWTSASTDSVFEDKLSRRQQALSDAPSDVNPERTLVHVGTRLQAFRTALLSQTSASVPGSRSMPMGVDEPNGPSPFTVRLEKTGAGRWIRGHHLLSSNTVQTQSVADVTDRLLLFYGLRNREQGFRATTHLQDPRGMRHVKYQQTFANLPVYGGEVCVHYNTEGKCTLINGIAHPIRGTVAIQASLDEATAFHRIRTHLGLTSDGGEIRTERVIYPEDQQARLAYRVEWSPALDQRWEGFVDARTGEVLQVYNRVMFDGPVDAMGLDLHNELRTFGAYQIGDTYYMIDTSKPMFDAKASTMPGTVAGGIVAYDAINQDEDLYYVTHSSSSRWNQLNAVSCVVTAGSMYDYLSTVHSLNSLDGQGGTIRLVVNYKENYANAFWNGRFLVFGNGDQSYFSDLAGALDIIGHEMGHGVVEYTANLIYQFQPGALNEAYADIFGTCLEYYTDPADANWFIAEDVTTPNTPGDCLRDLSDPSGPYAVSKLPAHMNDFADLPLDDDNGGVHTNCTIVAHAFYRLATNITIQKAEQIFFRALKFYLTQSSEFADARAAAVQAANDLFGEESAEHHAVESAFDAVGILAGQGSPDPEEYPPVEGEEIILAVHPYTRFLHMTTDLSSFPVLASVPVLSKPSVTDNGQLVLFVGTDYNPYAVSIDGSQFVQLDDQGMFYNVAISPDGSRLAATSNLQDGIIYAIDMNDLDDVKAWSIYTPTTREDAQSNMAYYADALDWSLDNQNILYDAYNVAWLQSGHMLDYWDINLMRYDDGLITRIFPPQPDGVDIGNAVFASNNNHIMAFDHVASDGSVTAMAVNLETGNVGQVTYNGTAFSRPDFSSDDNYIIYEYTQDDINYNVYQVSLAADGITGLNDDTMVIMNAIYPIWLTVGNRPTRVNNPEPKTMPVSATLSPVYPNPFNPVASVEFTLSNAGQVGLDVFDVRGRHVASVTHGLFPAGHHECIFDGSNLPSGVYILRLKTSDQILQRKMTLLK